MWRLAHALVALGGAGIAGGCGAATSSSNVASVTVTPGTAKIQLLATQSYVAEVRDASGALVADRPVIWTSSDTRVAIFADPAVGEARGVGVGKTDIRATVDGITSEPAELEVVAAAVGGGSCNFERARWKGPVRHVVMANGPNVGVGRFTISGDATFESALNACVITLVEGNLSIQGSVLLRGCTVSYAGSGTVKPTDGGITLENRPRDTPPRVKYTGQGLSQIETTVTTACPEGTTTVKGPLAFQWLSIPPIPEYFTDPALSAFVGTSTITHAEGSNTFDWALAKQPP